MTRLGQELGSKKFIIYPLLVLPISIAQNWNFNPDWTTRFELRAPFQSTPSLDLGSKYYAPHFD